MASRQAFSEQIRVMATIPVFVRLAVLVGPAEGRPCPVALLVTLLTQISLLAPYFAAVARPVLWSLLAHPYCVLICLLRLLVSGCSLLHLLTQVV